MIEEPAWWEDMIESSEPDEENKIWITVGEYYDWNSVIGTCANCGEHIFKGNFSTEVHDACSQEYANWLYSALNANYEKDLD